MSRNRAIDAPATGVTGAVTPTGAMLAATMDTGASASSSTPSFGADGSRAGPPPRRWTVRLLGAVEAREGDSTIERWPSRAVAALLARLALWPTRAHAREELIELLWPGVDLDVGRNRLRQALSTLKALLERGLPADERVLVADRTSVRVASGALQCDAVEFERAARAGNREAARRWYQGELMPGHYEDWVLDERRRLASLFDRLDGPTPTPAPAHALPSYWTRRFGTEIVASRLRALVHSQRLVTVCGGGGVGKTRLAVEVAQALRDEATLRGSGVATQPAFDLVAFVAFASCDSLAAMDDALRRAFALAGNRDDVADQLRAVLADRQALLVLDNLEQLLPAAAATVERLLRALPRVHVLVTSRTVLGLAGENEFWVPKLDAPAVDASLAEIAGAPAVALFVDRARAVRADFDLAREGAEAVAALVRLLGAMPLAIELAASRIRSVGVARMLEHLCGASRGEPPRGDGLQWLSRPGAGSEPRHASMADVVAWSWRQLGATERALVEALTVFPAGAPADAACAVAQADGSGELLLDDLVRHSLLMAERSRDGSIRFSMAEPVREFVHAGLDHGHWKVLRARQRRWCRDWALQLGTTPPLGAMHAEMPNLLSALGSAVADGVPDEALELAIALRPALNDVPLPPSGVERLRRAVESSTHDALRAPALTLLAVVAYDQGQREQALREAEQGLALCERGSVEHGRALHTVASLRWRITRECAGIDALLDEALAIAERHRHFGVQASVHALRGFIAGTRRDGAAEAEALQRRALELWERQGNRHAVNSGHYNLAVRAFGRRAWAECLERLQTVCVVAREDEDWSQLSQALNVRGNALAALRRHAEAADAYLEAAEVAWAAANPIDLCYALWNAPATLAHLRRPEAAAKLMAFAARDWETRFGALGSDDQRELRRVRRLVQVQSGIARRAQWNDDGRRLDPRGAIALLRASCA